MFNLKMSKKMKKFFSLMLVALVMLGVTACEQNVTIDTPKSEGLSFYAEIAMTRASINDEDGDKIWNTTWEGNETLTVYNEEYTELYKFTNSIEEPNMFSCNEEGVENIVGQNIIIELTHGEDCYISDMGKKGLLISESITVFNPTETISLHARNSFLRYTYNGEGIVTLSLEYEGTPFITNDIPSGASTYTSSNTGEQWVSFNAPDVTDGSVVSAVLSYSINDIKVKETTINLAQGKVYNLGTLTEPSFTVYVTPQPKSSAADWTTVNVYAWNDAWNNGWPGEEITANTTVINGYTYYAYTFPVSANNTSAKIIVNNGTNQTADIELGTLTQDLYVVYSVAMHEVYSEAPAEGSIEEYVAPAVKQMIYLDATFWDPSSARFAAYFWEPIAAVWVDMTDTNNDGIYECEVPEGATKVIFCRMNKTAMDNNWDNKWNQTDNLTVTGHIGMKYVVNQWDSANDSQWQSL